MAFIRALPYGIVVLGPAGDDAAIEVDPVRLPGNTRKSRRRWDGVPWAPYWPKRALSREKAASISAGGSASIDGAPMARSP